ncbi:HTH domain-containing protein [Ulvibacter sp. MAR_2010_11]|uniref:helix-turn-helix transcriptional regulator n=1 Tax=Ulvibacter sp. MAR_2010_11 TaxID=1250229 RepID=UPI000C2B598C|nr:WYL domain-containing protein [Ulvibacter sp. MAR_2010_11]PKA82023.1 HTH domain-containing protein [Ulvibacter sp. MAR_2010_11]
MNRLTRITSVLIQLQSKQSVTAREISDRFEISLRTVYRDIKTLQESGVPIGSLNGSGYFIVDGYSLPPIMITKEEANALSISEKFILNQGDTFLKKDFNSLLLRIKSILRNFDKDNITKLENKISSSSLSENFKSNSLSIIQKAISNNTVVKIHYHSLYKNEVSERDIEALGLYLTQKAWIVVAHCRLRNAIREFRLDRIVTTITTSQIFDFQEEFNLLQYLDNLTAQS